MSLRKAVLAVALQAAGLASAAALPEPVTTSLQKRADVDCGTWTMYCNGTPNGGQPAYEACNNACYFINNIRGGDYTATYRTDGNGAGAADNARNRHQSGCNLDSTHGGSNSICRLMSISQKLGDEVDDVTCDEFPMADWIQDDFPAGGVNELGDARNSLRCISRSQNSAAGGQFGSFRDNVGSGLDGRTCQGAMNAPNTDYHFKIAFNTDGAPGGELQYCDGIPSNELDFREFFMTELQNGGNGENNFPANWDLDNHYAVANQDGWQEVEQCHVDVLRTSGDNYDATMFNVDNAQLATKAAPLNNDGDHLQLDPTGGFAHLFIVRTGQMGQAGTVGSRVDFKYRVNTDLSSSAPLIDFDWTTESTGYDTRYTAARVSGGYCKVDDIQENEDGDSQEMTCYFPCPQVPA
ncbi:hypothetical protein BDV96DRAFT_633072 [Lophiotrema nucula]|uniref:Deoxyribonuclease NucA/NucB domain-containing protein n=1 Tax=Lophiotrema nucula TaxID=690887 RepID=A0A6A5Z5A7_9PLEO|nr:hypothetical protein BDV96DRAFT_633072 [Lophiotrema nucula]